MGLIKEFKEFAMRGNVVDMAVGVIIGGAFGKIVTSMIEDLIMPVVGKAVGNVDFSNLYVPLTQKVSDAIAAAPGGALALADARKVGPVFAYGNFITVLINFIILAFCIFLVVKAMNTLKKRLEAEPAPVPAKPPEPTPQEKLLAEIRDILRTRP
ncbi:MAG TPA: large conductance mechanosensitive channel protein MscL [Methylomirabilota bacterium]|nr:large conductance mechanosensitive channel protein MscL [Methylomirabilota bacterium]